VVSPTHATEKSLNCCYILDGNVLSMKVRVPTSKSQGHERSDSIVVPGELTCYDDGEEDDTITRQRSVFLSDIKPFSSGCAYLKRSG
jgi:hypothetical protein